MSWKFDWSAIGWCFENAPTDSFFKTIRKIRENIELDENIE
jgi:hypothetical protein